MGCWEFELKNEQRVGNTGKNPHDVYNISHKELIVVLRGRDADPYPLYISNLMGHVPESDWYDTQPSTNCRSISLK